MKRLVMLILIVGMCLAQDYTHKYLLFPIANPNYIQGKIALSSYCSSLRDGVKYMAWNVPAAYGTPIIAPADCYVEAATIAGYEGSAITLRLDYNTTIRFCHNSEQLCVKGQRLRKGDMFARVGMSGRTTGSHSRIVIEVNGERAFFNSTTFGMKYEQFEYSNAPFDCKKTMMYRGLK